MLAGMPYARYLFWLALLLLMPLRAAAQDGIHRCIGPDGNPLFTDQPCAALQATPVNTPRAQIPPSPPGASMPLTEPTPPPILCASSVTELRQSVVDAFASRDPNRLAGLMLWGGHGREAVVADIRSMYALMQRPLLDVGEASDEQPPGNTTDSNINDFDHLGQSETAAAPPPPRPASADHEIVVRTAANDGSGTPHETRFGVVRRSGCLWLRAEN